MGSKLKYKINLFFIEGGNWKEKLIKKKDQKTIKK